MPILDSCTWKLQVCLHTISHIVSIAEACWNGSGELSVRSQEMFCPHPQRTHISRCKDWAPVCFTGFHKNLTVNPNSVDLLNWFWNPKPEFYQQKQYRLVPCICLDTGSHSFQGRFIRIANIEPTSCSIKGNAFSRREKYCLDRQIVNKCKLQDKCCQRRRGTRS